MKYLIISDGASPHIYNFIKNILNGRGYEIYILRHSLMPIPKQYLEYYKENNITVFTSGTENEKRSYFSTLKRFWKKCCFLMKLGKVDVCHIHYLHRQSLLLYRLFRKKFGYLILSYWGTDIINPSPKEIIAQKKCFPYANKITVTVEHSRKVFQKRFGHQYDDKLCFGRFAGGAIQAIKEFSNNVTKKQCRENFSIPSEKLCVVCGYNANPAQHQDIILKEVSKLPANIKEKIHLIVPLQYSRINLEYIATVKDLARNCGCSYEILEEYVSFERNAMMCLATDIYLNLRDTDAFSNAMKEQIYSGSHMIQGEWLVYDELDQSNAPVTKIKNIEDLHVTLTQLLCKIKFSNEIKLFEPFYNLFSIQSVRSSWDKIFNEINKK